MALPTIILQAALGLVWWVLGATAASASGLGDIFHPTRLIVQFSDVGSAKFRRRDGSLEVDGFMRTLSSQGANVEPAFSYTSTLFHGASFDFHNATQADIANIQSLPEVEKVWPASYITLDVEAEGIIDSAPDVWSPHKETNVSVVQDLGHNGAGVIVAIVDSGIDYTHPALGGGYGPGFKVESGWNFVDNNTDVKDCFGHGTHVAGIVAANDTFIKGVAPDARLRGYRIFGCVDGSTNDMAIAALLRAHEDGADVINASLGSANGFPDNPVAVVLSKIQAEGTLVVVAAGNSGVNGPYFSNDLGNVYGGLTVASIEHEELAAYQITAHSTSGNSRTMLYVSSDLRPFNLVGDFSAAYVAGNDTWAFDACFPVNKPPTLPDYQVLVLPRSKLCDSDWQSMDNTLNNKVTWAFWVNFEDAEYTVPGRIIYDAAIQPKGSAVISYEDGAWLVDEHQNGYNVSFTFTDSTTPLGASRPSLAGGRMDSWSSWGPTIDSRMKPEVAAPGGSIYSTWLNGTWAILSGTSMASPYIAGFSALVLEAFGTRSKRADAATYARSRIITSARSIKNPFDTDPLASVAQQGAGVVDAVKAIEYVTSAYPPQLYLNDTDHFAPNQEIEVTNAGNAAVSYTISHVAELTYFVRSLDTGRIALIPTHSNETRDMAQVEFSTTQLNIGPGETQKFSVMFTEPVGSDPATYPVYGGGVVISGDNGETLRVPYIGIKGSINSFPHWGGDSRPFLNESGETMVDGATYTFNDSTTVPYAPFEIVWSTNEVSLDFVDRYWDPANWTYPTIAGENNFYGHFRTEGDNSQFIATNFPLIQFPRGATQYYARPGATFTNGKEIVSGQYRYLRRSLKTFGDPHDIDGWQWDLSPWFEVIRG
ncbi:hypothetical protein JX265_010223 [Neoarthrinium moseri]|uniref:Minor extracellular protease vpr n=1 Tax=Neoarthrinium moseri TaxID=1658444 RepID=A0A9Q0AKJ3_9PEZI|nr:hypothetical protein JX265_010223 [Neoarthrinium moseri]